MKVALPVLRGSGSVADSAAAVFLPLSPLSLSGLSLLDLLLGGLPCRLFRCHPLLLRPMFSLRDFRLEKPDHVHTSRNGARDRYLTRIALVAEPILPLAGSAPPEVGEQVDTKWRNQLQFHLLDNRARGTKAVPPLAPSHRAR